MQGERAVAISPISGQPSEPVRRAASSCLHEPIETLLFDFGGTLDADGVAWKERFYAFYRAEGLAMAPADFELSFFTADDQLVGSLAPETDLAATVDALLAKLEPELARRGAGWSNGERARRVASRFLSEASAAFARNRPILQALSKRYRLGVVSNFYGNLEGVCRGAGLASLFGVLVHSHCVGAEKPDPAIFHAALDRLGAAPETTALVGDSLRRDREGARRTGMHFIWMAPQDAPAVPAHAEPPVKHAVTDLRDLMKILP